MTERSVNLGDKTCQTRTEWRCSIICKGIHLFTEYVNWPIEFIDLFTEYFNWPIEFIVDTATWLWKLMFICLLGHLLKRIAWSYIAEETLPHHPMAHHRTRISQNDIYIKRKLISQHAITTPRWPNPLISP